MNNDLRYEKGKRYLITTHNWFYGADGKMYNCVYGTLLDICSDSELLGGLNTNRHSTNWYLVIGDKRKMKIAGCQVFYGMEVDDGDVNLGSVEEYQLHEGVYCASKRSSNIYCVD